MKKCFQFVLFLFVAFIYIGCKDEDSYAADREKERKQIQSFLQKGVVVRDDDAGDYFLNAPGPYRIISEQEFYANDSTTDVSKNEYVLFPGSGIYMQIVRKGTGEKLRPNETATVLCRYTEFNIATDSIQTLNNTASTAGLPDVMSVTNTLGTFSASFLSGQMKTAYSAKVPSGWLFPLTFIKLGRQDSPDGEIAKVRLIVPSTEGQSNAYTRVYPCFYEITYQRGR